MSKHIVPPPMPDINKEKTAVGITTTVPSEVIFAGGYVPADLNNLFITAQFPQEYIKQAEQSGFPKTCCSWTKGVYGAAHYHNLKKIVVVVQGDCSNSCALAEMLENDGIECVPFAFPFRPDSKEMTRQLEIFCRYFKTDIKDSEKWLKKLNQARLAARRIDSLTWEEGKVTGLENHLWLVSTGDFCADPHRYTAEAGKFISQAEARKRSKENIRLGFAGVPPVVPSLYDFLESKGGRVLYNETQRQFSMPFGGKRLSEVYTNYTYPYGIRYRMNDIRREVIRRRLDGIIHYVQSFCYRRIEDRILREGLSVPVITLEHDRPSPELNGQLKTRLEAFVELLRARKSGQRIFSL